MLGIITSWIDCLFHEVNNTPNFSFNYRWRFRIKTQKNHIGTFIAIVVMMSVLLNCKIIEVMSYRSILKDISGYFIPRKKSCNIYFKKFPFIVVLCYIHLAFLPSDYHGIV